jgi:FKBP-type peptidyl-prolyl cis-trans isomerase FkpA
MKRFFKLYLGTVLVGFVALQVHAQASTTPPVPYTQNLLSGVKIVHLVVGTGARPVATDKVRVHYRGRLPDGFEFDNSYTEGLPAIMPLNKVIRCWTQALQHMQVGGKVTLSCPAEMSYGSEGLGNVIPPNTPLTFDVELLGIEK